MDWLPIMIVCLLSVFYFTAKSQDKWWQRLVFFGALVFLNTLFRMLDIPKQFAISSGYVITAITVLTPFFLYAYKTQWRNTRYLVSGMLTFALAVTFRTLDSTTEILPMGTHWLWHTFGGVAVFLLLYYIYLDDVKLIEVA